MIPDVSDSQSVQRRGRIVIVAMIALFLLVCLVLGVFLWQRQQEENRLDALRQTGVLLAGAPDWGYPISSVEPLEGNRGVVVHYADDDGDVATGFHVLNLRAGPEPDLCALLAEAEPEFAKPDRCEVTDNRLSAALLGPSTILAAEGQLNAGTLIVLVSHPVYFTDDELRTWLDATELVSLRELVERVG